MLVEVVRAALDQIGEMPEPAPLLQQELEPVSVSDLRELDRSLGGR
jgi:hypothetical protein